MRKLIVLLAIIASLASCQSTASREAEIQKAKQATIDSMAAAASAKQHVIDSMRTVAARNAEKNTQRENNSQATTARKKGLGNVSKGAIIGAGAGAITGALVDKKHGEGAIVGSLIGAGAGAATGVVINHAQKKKKKKTTQ
jgi:hypothetical protein